jgi:hypothetical protein
LLPVTPAGADRFRTRGQHACGARRIGPAGRSAPLIAHPNRFSQAVLWHLHTCR